MKKVEHYICEICGTEYNEKEKCKLCEYGHHRPKGIDGAQWYPIGQAATKHTAFDNVYEEILNLEKEYAENGDTENVSRCIKLENLMQYFKEELRDCNAEYNNGWVPFQQRELTEEEKAFYGKDIKYMLDCKLPEEDEEILITYASGIVGVDVFMRDRSECYLDSGNDFITEAIAWQPLPEPYKD